MFGLARACCCPECKTFSANADGRGYVLLSLAVLVRLVDFEFGPMLVGSLPARWALSKRLLGSLIAERQTESRALVKTGIVRDSRYGPATRPVFCGLPRNVGQALLPGGTAPLRP